MALTQISTGGVKNDAVTASKIPANAVGSSEIADDAVGAAQIADDGVAQAAVADEAIDEARLQISNAGSNGQFLQKQSGNTGGLTWAAANEYTHPNHSGEVTSTADGAQVIASNVVDEDNLKISNSGTNGQFLQKQSGNTGGLTWADVTIPPAGNTFTAVANGSIANNKAVKLDSDGKVSEIKMETQIDTSPANVTGGTGIGGTNVANIQLGNTNVDSVAYNAGSDRVVVVFRNQTNNHLYYKLFTNTSGGWNETAMGTVDSDVNNSNFCLCSLSSGRFACAYWDGSRHRIRIGELYSVGEGITWGDDYIIDGQDPGSVNGYYKEPHMVAIGDNRIIITARAGNSTARWGNNLPGIIIGDVTNDDEWTYRDAHALTNSADHDNYRDIAYDATNGIVGIVWRDSGIKMRCIKVDTGTSATVTWGAISTLTSNTPEFTRIEHNPTAGNWVTAYAHSGQSSTKIQAHTVNSSTLAITSGSESSWSIDSQYGINVNISDEGAAFILVVQHSNYPVVRCATFSGTTITLNSAVTIGGGYGSLVAALSSVYVSHDDHVMIFYASTGASPGLVGNTHNTVASASNLTSGQNYVGFADQAYTNGQTATIKTYGSVVDTLSGLTVATDYYVRQNGSIGTSTDFTSGFAAGTPYAGRAISSSKLIVQHPSIMQGL